MSKPNGIGIGLDAAGRPHWFVRPMDRVADQIWDAVREAINANMLPEQFKAEAAQAWTYYLNQDAKSAREELGR